MDEVQARTIMISRFSGPLLKSAATTVTDFLYPPTCLSCSHTLANHGSLCGTCWSQIDFLTPPFCDRLGIPLPIDLGEETVSAAAIAKPPAYDRARAATAYDGIVRNLIHNLKYRDRQEALDQFAKWMSIAGKELTSDADLLIPVPLYWTRLWQRRFNQAVELARALTRYINVPTNPFILSRVKKTKSQIGMSAQQRKKNVAGAFQIQKSKRRLLEGRNIIIIDDVITTGATVEACAKTLKNAGAARVDVLAIARVTDRAAITI